MKKETSLPVRLDSDLNEKTEKIADQLGIPKSTLVRMLITSFVRHMQENGNKITLPLDWSFDVIGQ